MKNSAYSTDVFALYTYTQTVLQVSLIYALFAKGATIVFVLFKLYFLYFVVIILSPPKTACISGIPIVRKMKLSNRNMFTNIHSNT